MTALRRATESELAEMQRFAEEESRSTWGRWAHRMVIDASTNYGDAIRAICRDRSGPFPVAFDFEDTTLETPKLVFGTHEDPWQCARDLAVAIGMELTQDASVYRLRRRELRTVPKHWAEETP